MSPIRLALVRQRYNPYGGAERFVERAMAALSGQPIALTLITRQWSGTPQHEIKVCNPFHIGRLWRDIGFARCVQRTVAIERFDLVQSHERIPGCDIFRAGDGVHATWIELLGGSRGALGRMALSLSPWHRHILRQEARMFADPRLRAVICNSRMVRDDIERRFGIGPERLHVVANGVDLERFRLDLRTRFRNAMRRQLGLMEDDFVVLLVGSGFERKGVRILIEAIAALGDRSVALLVVGADKHATRYAALAARLGIGDRVNLLGGQQDVVPYFGCADLFALPTLYDPFPNAALEALASGLPVVTTRSSGAAELLDADCGSVLEARAAEPLRSALAHWRRRLADPMKEALDREAARAKVLPLGLERTAAQLGALYAGLMSDATTERAAASGVPAGSRSPRYGSV